MNLTESRESDGEEEKKGEMSEGEQDGRRKLAPAQISDLLTLSLFLQFNAMTKMRLEEAKRTIGIILTILTSI